MSQQVYQLANGERRRIRFIRRTRRVVRLRYLLAPLFASGLAAGWLIWMEGHGRLEDSVLCMVLLALTTTLPLPLSTLVISLSERRRWRQLLASPGSEPDRQHEPTRLAEISGTVEGALGGADIVRTVGRINRDCYIEQQQAPASFRVMTPEGIALVDTEFFVLPAALPSFGQECRTTLSPGDEVVISGPMLAVGTSAHSREAEVSTEDCVTRIVRGSEEEPPRVRITKKSPVLSAQRAAEIARLLARRHEPIITSPMALQTECWETLEDLQRLRVASSQSTTWAVIEGLGGGAVIMLVVWQLAAFTRVSPTILAAGSAAASLLLYALGSLIEWYSDRFGPDLVKRRIDSIQVGRTKLHNNSIAGSSDGGTWSRLVGTVHAGGDANTVVAECQRESVGLSYFERQTNLPTFRIQTNRGSYQVDAAYLRVASAQSSTTVIRNGDTVVLWDAVRAEAEESALGLPAAADHDYRAADVEVLCGSERRPMLIAPSLA